MKVDITEIINEISEEVEFSKETVTTDEFGAIKKATVKVKYSVGIVEKDDLIQYSDAGEMFKKNNLSVWINETLLSTDWELIGASFFYGKNTYLITGIKPRNNFVTHLEYHAEKRID